MKVKTKKKLVRLLSSLMITTAILNLIVIIFGFGNKAYAADGFSLVSAVNGASILMLGIPLILINVLKLIIIIIGLILQSVISGAYTSLEPSGNGAWTGLKEIIFAGANESIAGFNSSKFLDINFFDLSGSTDDSLYVVRTAIAKWYYILRLIAAAILLVILIYVGIRMALSTIAQEQAKYKQMLVDWVTSLALLFLLHYIIMFIISINNTLVNVLAGVCKDSTGDMMERLTSIMWSLGIEGVFAAIVYVVFVGQIFSFFILYLKRMITVGFLIMIAPLITITYSIDKIGDGKAQALNAWLKELSYNILIQPFHCVIFMSFFDAIALMLDPAKGDPYNIGAYAFAVVVMMFMKKAEDLLRKIFHFEASSMSSLSESAQNIANARGTFKNIGMKAGNAAMAYKASGGIKATKKNLQNFKENRAAMKSLKKEFKKGMHKKSDGSEYNSFREFKNSSDGIKRVSDIKQTNAQEMKKKAQEKREKRYDRVHGKGAYAKKVKEQAKVEKDAYLDEKAREAYDAKFGEGSYDKVKKTAAKKDKYGNSTGAAKKAQAILDNQKKKAKTAEKAKNPSYEKNLYEKAADKVYSNTGVDGVKKTLKNGWDKTGGKVYSNMRAFAEDPNNKFIMTALKDTTRVASALSLGAFGAGATGQFNDAISFGQMGYGLATGLLQNTTTTVLSDSSEKLKQLAELNGLDINNIEELMTQMMSIMAEKNAGLLDSKSIISKLEQLENVLKNKGADDSQINNFKLELSTLIQQDNARPADIQNLIDSQFSTLSDSDKKDINKSAQDYATINIKAILANSSDTLEKSGMSNDVFNENVIDRATKS